MIANSGTTATKSNTQPTESYDAMMKRMHPDQPSNNDMSSHHGGAP